MKVSPVERIPSAATLKEWPGRGREEKGPFVFLLTACKVAQAAFEFGAWPTDFGPLASWGAIKTFSIFR